MLFSMIFQKSAVCTYHPYFLLSVSPVFYYYLRSERDHENCSIYAQELKVLIIRTMFFYILLFFFFFFLKFEIN
jgi:hypothetical protein